MNYIVGYFHADGLYIKLYTISGTALFSNQKIHFHVGNSTFRPQKICCQTSIRVRLAESIFVLNSWQSSRQRFNANAEFIVAWQPNHRQYWSQRDPIRVRDILRVSIQRRNDPEYLTQFLKRIHCNIV